MKTETIEENVSNAMADRYWIKPGISVTIAGTDLKVIVDKVVYRRTEGRPGGDGEMHYIRKIVGVMCHWLDKDNKYQTGMFHSKELIKVN